MLALSIVAPGGQRIAEGRKTLEIRSWRPDHLPVLDLLIVENHKYLTQAGDSDPEGRIVAIVDVLDVRPWREVDVEAACARQWVPGYWAWSLSSVRCVTDPIDAVAERGLYEMDLVPSGMAKLLYNR
ncbi:MAG: ASCH domain-containing protein [Burkholderiales bacterium]|nr:ASCH domain-containing protein [Burkholderiales bacterium]